MKRVQTRSFFWSVFSRIRTKYGKIQTGKNSIFGDFSHSAVNHFVVVNKVIVVITIIVFIT